MIPEGFGGIAEQLRRSTVQVIQSGRGERGSGSGVIWTADGRIVTNAHVARDARTTVELWDGRRFQAEVGETDVRRDLASLRIQATGLPAVSVGDSSALRAGELVMAIGNPLGFIGALTTGVIHGVGPVDGLGRQSWVQASIRLAPGNSGGPLANSSGHLIGINTMVMAGNIGLAIPGAAVTAFLQNGAPPALGVVVRPVSIENRPARNGRALGLLILEVSPQGPAAAASLLIGDVLTGANGRPFHSVDDLSEALASAPSGLVVLQFLRGGRPARRAVTARLAVKRAPASARSAA